MKKILEVAIVLSAVDKATRVLNDALSKQQAKLKEMSDRSKNLMQTGMGQMAGGAALAASLAPAISAYAELEDASVRLKTAMMEDGGKVNSLFESVNKLAIDLGNKLPGTTADFQGMLEVLLTNGVPAQSILAGVGKSAAYLSVALKLPYEEAAKMAAKLKEATGTADADMEKFMDTIARTKNLGVEAGEMQYAFGRSAGALKLMGIQGLEASKSMSVLYASLIRAGMSGETVGTGFASIMNNLLNPKKMQETTDAAKALGVSLEFFDKQGNFKGIENLVGQLDKLRAFSADKRASVVNALTGGGQDAQMLQTLISNGVEGFNKMSNAMAKQADLNDKVVAQLGTLKNLWEATTGTATNMLAAFGETFAPELKKIIDLLGQAAASFQAFVAENPRLFKFIGLFIAFAGAVMVVVGALTFLKGAFIALQVFLMANPITAIIMGIATAALLIYTYWEPIKKFFIDLWTTIKGKFNDFLSFLEEIGKKFYEAGEKIVSTIADGIMAGVNKVKSAISKVTEKAREYLPFSPAKAGAFRDLHRVKIVETIASAVRPAPLTKAMGLATAAAISAMPVSAKTTPIRSTSQAVYGGNTTVHYNPTISIGSATEADKIEFAKMLKQHGRDIVRLVEEAQRKNNRTKF